VLAFLAPPFLAMQKGGNLNPNSKTKNISFIEDKKQQ